MARHDASQGFPSGQNAFVDAQGRLTQPWYQFLVTMWSKLSQGQYDVSVVPAAATPWTFTTESNGTVVLTGGIVQKVEFSRDGKTFFPIGGMILSGASMAVGVGDQLRISYTAAPQLLFIPL